MADTRILNTSFGYSVYITTEGKLSSLESMYVKDRTVHRERGLYINRLFVHQSSRGRGIAKEMMLELCRFADETNVNVLLDINAYGDMSHADLSKFYAKFGFVVLDSQGLRIRKPKNGINKDYSSLPNLYTDISIEFNYEIVTDLCNQVLSGNLGARKDLHMYMLRCYDMHSPVNRKLRKLVEAVEEDMRIRQ